MKMKNGGAAFPHSHEVTEELGIQGCYQRVLHQSDGMTLRDYFAGHALVAGANRCSPNGNFEALAKYAYKIADAMLKARDNNEI